MFEIQRLNGDKWETIDEALDRHTAEMAVAELSAEYPGVQFRVVSAEDLYVK